MFLLSIPTPCHEKWEEMTPNKQGAFCSVCSKTVVDFTALSDEQVQNYFLHKRGEKTCGRFRNDQLAGKDNSLNKLLAASIPFWKKFLAIVVIVFGSLLTGCRENVTGKLLVQEQGLKGTPAVISGVTTYEGMLDVSEQVDTVITEMSNTMGIIEDVPLPDSTGLIEEPFTGEVVITENCVLMHVLISEKRFDKHGNEIKGN